LKNMLPFDQAEEESTEDEEFDKQVQHATAATEHATPPRTRSSTSKFCTLYRPCQLRRGPRKNPKV
jgi:hypothetical protein